MSYILESNNEFRRLEDQSSTEAYDYKSELRGFHPQKGQTVLDAGCGSGIVSRYLAETFPETTIHGCDFSPDRIKEATHAAQKLSNVSFSVQNLQSLSLSDQSFDHVILRYVAQHQSPDNLLKLVAELQRVLKTGGELWIIDADGFIFNLYPQTAKLASYLGRLHSSDQVDLMVGRKLPYLLMKLNFAGVHWEVQNFSFTGNALKVEKENMAQRFNNARPYFDQLFGGSKEGQEFVRLYLDTMDEPGCVSFFNKFIVRAIKPKIADVIGIRS